MQKINFTFPFFLDDGLLSIEFEVEVKGWYPGEPMVRYDRDGSGYPGSGPEFSGADMYLKINENKRCKMPDDFVAYLIKYDDNFMECLHESGHDAMESERDYYADRKAGQK